MVFGLATGAAFYVGEQAERSVSPLDYRCNAIFTLTDGRAIFILDCHKTQNQVSFEWKGPEDQVFDPLRGPDLCSEGLHCHIMALVDDEQHAKYFEVI